MAQKYFFPVFWLKSLFETILGKYKKEGGYRGFRGFTVKFKSFTGQICPLPDRNRVNSQDLIV